MKKITFVIAEKSFIVRTGLLKIINSFHEISVIKEVDNFNSAIKFANKTNPDFLIINIKLIEDAHEDLKMFFSNNISTKTIIFVGTKRSKEHFSYFDEQISIDDEKDVVSKKIQSLINSKLPKNVLSDEELSEREKEVLRQVAMGKTNKEIAEILFISSHTVITHRKHITGKLDIKTVAGLTVYAILNNIIDIDEAV